MIRFEKKMLIETKWSSLKKKGLQIHRQQQKIIALHQK